MQWHTPLSWNDSNQCLLASECRCQPCFLLSQVAILWWLKAAVWRQQRMSYKQGTLFTSQSLNMESAYFLFPYNCLAKYLGNFYSQKHHRMVWQTTQNLSKSVYFKNQVLVTEYCRFFFLILNKKVIWEQYFFQELIDWTHLELKCIRS